MAKKYNDKYYARYGDPRTAHWLLMDNQMYVFIIGAAYLILAKWILPRLMRNRKPFQMQILSLLYNTGMMLLNAWLFFELISLTWLKAKFNWSCQAVDFSNSEEALKVAEIGWIFLITTLLETLTTVLIALRQKDLLNVHIFLRMQTPIVVWYGLKFAPGGYNSLYILLASFVNSILHFHHTAIILLPFLRNPYYPKIELPALYLIQFTSICIYNAYLYFFSPKSCKVSFFILRLNIGSGILFFIFAKDFFLSKSKNRIDKFKSPKSSEELKKMK